MGSRHEGFSSCGAQALELRSVVVAHGLSCSAARGIFLDQRPGFEPVSPALAGGFFFFLKFFFLTFIYFLAALGLCCCEWAFSCGERELLFVVVRGLLIVASLVAKHGLQLRGFQ